MDKELETAINDLISRPAFAVLLRWIYEQGNVAGNPFTPNALNTSYNCGKMAQAQETLALIADAAPYFYPALMKEILDEYANRRDNSTGARARGPERGSSR